MLSTIVAVTAGAILDVRNPIMIMRWDPKGDYKYRMRVCKDYEERDGDGTGIRDGLWISHLLVQYFAESAANKCGKRNQS
jgi:hypothetical protein